MLRSGFLPLWPLLAGLCLSGCISDGSTTAASNAFVRADTTTVAFESIDGPPPQVFDRLVSALDSEAKLRGIPVASREDAATYRIRSYLSAQVRGPRITIAWTWDVYDRNQQRALRLSGTEPATRSGADAWAAADDTLLRRIAQAGLTGLNGLLNNRAAPAPLPAPPTRDSGPAIADNGPNSTVSAAMGFKPN